MSDEQDVIAPWQERVAELEARLNRMSQPRDFRHLIIDPNAGPCMCGHDASAHRSGFPCPCEADGMCHCFTPAGRHRFTIDTEPIHDWFELTYAQYLTIPRSVLQSMPIEWQARFMGCLEELDEAIDWRPARGQYMVTLEVDGIDVQDPLQDYQRGRRRIPVRKEQG